MSLLRGLSFFMTKCVGLVVYHSFRTLSFTFLKVKRRTNAYDLCYLKQEREKDEKMRKALQFGVGEFRLARVVLL